MEAGAGLLGYQQDGHLKSPGKDRQGLACGAVGGAVAMMQVSCMNVGSRPGCPASDLASC